MKTKIITLIIGATLMAFNGLAYHGIMPNGDNKKEQVVINGSSTQPRLIDEMPQGWYYPELRRLTIEFPAVGFEPYVLSVTSGYATLDYYVTTPQMCVLISPDTVEVDLLLETDGGDLYWGSFDTTSGTLTE